MTTPLPALGTELQTRFTTTAAEGSAPTTVATEPPTARYCVTASTSLVEALRSPWVVLKDLPTGNCNVYAIDNLQGFERLTELRLDNNIIEKIITKK